jgi:hypothetical protein
LTTKTKLTRRTAFRLAGLVAAIISTTNVIIFSVLFFVISQQLSQRSRSHINEIRKTLVEIDTASGFDALAAMVGRHAVVAESEEDIYLLTDKAGNYVAGNIRAVPRFEGWKTIDWKDLPLIENWTTPRTSTAVMATWTPTKNGYLLIGDGNGDIIDAQRLLLNGLLWGIGLSIVSAIVGGYILGLKGAGARRGHGTRSRRRRIGTFAGAYTEKFIIRRHRSRRSAHQYDPRSPRSPDWKSETGFD